MDVSLETPLTSEHDRHVAISCHCMSGKGETEVEDLSKGASEQLNQAADQAKEAAGEAASGAIEQAQSQAQDAASGAMEQAQDAAGEAIEQAKDILPGS